MQVHGICERFWSKLLHSSEVQIIAIPENMPGPNVFFKEIMKLNCYFQGEGPI